MSGHSQVYGSIQTVRLMWTATMPAGCVTLKSVVVLFILVVVLLFSSSNYGPTLVDRPSFLFAVRNP